MFIQITGARDWDDPATIMKALTFVRPKGAQFGDVVRHGNCRGADKQAGKIAKAMGFEIDPMPAQWRLHKDCRCSAWQVANSYCRYAGPRRNLEMLDKPVDVVLAFHPSIANSSGTKHCVNAAVQRGFRVYLFDGVHDTPIIVDKEV